MELKKRMLGEFIFLMKTDFVIPVLNYMIDSASKIDESLVAYFIQNVSYITKITKTFILNLIIL